MDIRKLKFNNLFPTTPKKSTPSSSGYGILDQFINNILPMIQNQGPSRQERMMERTRRDENNIKRDEMRFNRPAPALPQISRSMLEPEKPMNVVLGNQLTPYQEATLGMRGQELNARTGLNERKFEQSENKLATSEADRATRTAILQQKADLNTLTDKEKLELIQLNATKRDVVQQDNALDRIVKTSEGAMARTKEGANAAMERQKDGQIFATGRDKERFENDITKINKTFTNRQSLAADRPDTKQLVLQRANELITRNPSYADFIEIDQDTGVVEVKPQTKDWSGNPVGPSDIERQQIRDALFSTDPTKATSVIVPDAAQGPGSIAPNSEAPPPGMKPGGRWITMRNGKRVYEEPDA